MAWPLPVDGPAKFDRRPDAELKSHFTRSRFLPQQQKRQ